MYGLKQAPKAWYERLNKYLQQQGFKKVSVDNNLYVKYEDDHLLIVVVYVDEIIFGSDVGKLGHRFENFMQIEFEMSIKRELSFFLGLQITQSP